MKWLIASDIHGSACYCRELMKAWEREGADRLLLLGDLLYHGPRNDLPAEYDPKQVLTMLNQKKENIYCVRGNCDSEVDQMVLEFPMMGDYCLLPVGERMIYATHGHRFHMHALPPMQPGDLLLHGHTHIPAWQPFGQDNFYLNPGSVSIPKEGSEHSSLILSGTEFVWKNLSGCAYHQLSL